MKHISTYLLKVRCTDIIYSRHRATYLWAHFKLTVEAVCARYKGTKNTDQAHHITPKLSQPFLWVSHGRMTLFFVWHRPFGTWEMCNEDGLFFQTTRLWIIPRRLNLWSSLQGRLGKKHRYDKILEKKLALDIQIKAAMTVYAKICEKWMQVKNYFLSGFIRRLIFSVTSH